MNSRAYRSFFVSVCFVVSIYTLLVSCSGSKGAAYQSVKSPAYAKKEYKQIMVFAKVDDDTYRAKLENTMVDLLNKNGFHAIPAYKNLTVSYKYDSTQFMSKINELKVDGFLAFSYLGQQTVVEDRYNYNGGMYNFYMGGAPPFDLETKAKKVGYVRLDFYNLDSRVSQYNTNVPVKLYNGPAVAIPELAQESLNRLKGDKIL